MNKRLVFKIKDGYNWELQTPEAMKLFGFTKNSIEKAKKQKTKNKTETAPSLEVGEVVLVQCNLIDNQYQQKSNEFYTFMPKKYAYLLNVEPGNLLFLKTHNAGLDKIVITFTDQNGRPRDIEEKVNLTLLINK